MTERASKHGSDEAESAAAEDAAASAGPEAAETGSTAIEDLRREADENWNKYLRVVAELENFRKRSQRELENARKYGVERFVQALLPVRDSLEAALAAADTADAATLIDGQRATLRLLDEALQSAGVSELDPHGEPFDPNMHEAMSMLPSPDAEPGSVIEVVQKGYVINERLMRPARVVVARPPAEEDTD